MKRRALAILLLTLVALVPVASTGEQTNKVIHIGFLRPDAPDFLLLAGRAVGTGLKPQEENKGQNS